MIKIAFIRIKRFKRKDGTKVEYAYIVENKRNRKIGKVKQKFRKYLGRVYRFDKVRDREFAEFHNIEDMQKYMVNNSARSIIGDLIHFELNNHGFVNEAEVLKKGDCFVNIREGTVYNQNGNYVALALNEGLLTTYAISGLINFKATFSDDETGYKLAKAFVEAGLKIPKEVFVGIFEKLV